MSKRTPLAVKQEARIAILEEHVLTLQSCVRRLAAAHVEARIGGRPWVHSSAGMRRMTDDEMIVCFPQD
jgi:hypothetical protein